MWKEYNCSICTSAITLTIDLFLVNVLCLVSSENQSFMNTEVCGADRPAAYLHPEEESFGTSFELQHIDPSGGALVHPFELTVIRKDDQILNQDMKRG